MKKTVIWLTGSVSLGLLIIVVLLFWYRQNHPTDSAIYRKLLGTWIPEIADGRSRTFMLSPDGHWNATVTGKVSTGSMEGTWIVRDGFLISTMTNNDLDMQVPSIYKLQITRIDGHEFVAQSKNVQTIYKRSEP